MNELLGANRIYNWEIRKNDVLRKVQLTFADLSWWGFAKTGFKCDGYLIKIEQENGRSVPTTYKLSLSRDALYGRQPEVKPCTGRVEPIRQVDGRHILDGAAKEVALIERTKELLTGYPKGIICVECHGWKAQHRKPLRREPRSGFG